MREPPTLTRDVTDAIRKSDGRLYCQSWYLSWKRGDREATLDGEFNAADLRSIADYMDYMNAEEVE